jgi:tripartite-type tricarboxylate transporter receptor subunit TctC
MTQGTRSTFARIAKLAALATAIACTPAFAQDFPAKPIRMISPFPAGNVNEIVMRIVGDRFKEVTGQPFVYEYKAGGAGVIAAQTLMSSAPDGYTILLCTSGMTSINPHAFAKLPYDPVRDFTPVTAAIRTQLIFAAHTSVAAGTLADFIAFAKSNPGKTSFASFTAGNPSHFAGVILNQLAGIDMLHVAYKGTPPAVQDLLGGQVMTAFVPLTSVKGHVEAGKLKAFALTGERSPLMPGVPTFKELGYPKMEIYAWTGFLAPAGTPPAIVQRLNREFTAALRQPEAQARLRAIDLEPIPNSPEEFAAMMKADTERWRDAVKASGFRAD